MNAGRPDEQDILACCRPSSPEGDVPDYDARIVQVQYSVKKKALPLTSIFACYAQFPE